MGHASVLPSVRVAVSVFAASDSISVVSASFSGDPPLVRTNANLQQSQHLDTALVGRHPRGKVALWAPALRLPDARPVPGGRSRPHPSPPPGDAVCPRQPASCVWHLRGGEARSGHLQLGDAPGSTGKAVGAACTWLMPPTPGAQQDFPPRANCRYSWGVQRSLV